MELQVIRSRGSFRRQIILTFVVGFFLLIAAFATYLVQTERDNLHRDNVDEATNMAQSLAVSALPWVLADDVAGLQEVVHAYRGYPDFSYAMVISPKGRVIAHSDPTLTGMYLTDPQSLEMLKSPHAIRIMEDSADRIDVAVPIELGKQQVGWVRVSELKTGSTAALRTMVRNNIAFLLVSTALSFLAATVIANRLGRHIRSLVQVAEAVQAGNYSTRVSVREGEGEIARLGNSLNSMLEALAQNEAALRESTSQARRFSDALDNVTAFVYIKNRQHQYIHANKPTLKLFGCTAEELNGSDDTRFFPPATVAQLKKVDDRVLEKGEQTQEEIEVIGSDGKTIYYLEIKTPIYDTDGTIWGLCGISYDITERKKAEEVLRLSEEALKDAQRIAHVGSWHMDLATNQVYWSEELYKMYGYDPSLPPPLYTESAKLFTPESWDRLSSAIARAAEAGVPYELELEMVSIRGRKGWMLAIGEQVRDTQGKAIMVRGVAMDITERKQAEIAARKNEALLQAIMKILPVGVWMLDANGQVIFGNDEAQKIWAGVRYVGIEQLGAYKGWWADTGKPVGPHDWAGSRAVEKGEIVAGEEVEIECFDGTHKFILDSAVPLHNDDGTIRGAVTVNQDITERMKLEMRLRQSFAYTRSLIEASLDPLVTVSPEGKITDVNTATEKATGLGRAELIGTVFSDYFTEPDKARAGYRKVFEKGYITDYPLALRHKDGHATDVLYNASLYRDEAGKVLGIFAAARDVTERNKAEEAVRRSEAGLAEAQHLAHIGNWSWDITTDRIFWSPEYYRIYNYDPALPTPNYQEHLNAYTSESAAMLDAAVKRAIEQGEPYALELQLAKPDVAGRWIYARGEVRRDAQGKIAALYGTAQDITERKKAEQALFEAQQIFRSLVESSPDIIARYDRDCKRTYVNPAYLNTTAAQPQNWIGTTPAQQSPLPEESATALQNLLHKVLDSGIADFIDVVWPMPDNTDHWFNVYAFPEFDRKGEVVSVMTVSRDITERKKAEQELAQLSLRNRMILDSAGEGIYGLDIGGRCTFVNPTAAQLLGFSIEEFIGQHSHALFHHTKADGTPYPVEECPVLSAYKQGLVHRGTDMYWRKDGTSFPVEFVSTPIIENGAVTGAVVAFNDITERKRAEENLRESEHSLAEAQRIAHLGNWNLDLVNNILSWSDEIYRIFEIDPKKFGATYEAFLGAIHPDDREKANLAYTESVKNRTPYEIEHRLLMQDGRIKYVVEKCETYYDENGKPVRSVGTVHDITERKKAEEEVRQLNAELEQRVQQRTAQLASANKELEAFSYSVSHDLRSPLRAIDGFSNILLEDYAGRLDDEGKRLVGIVRDNTIRMARLIDDILSFSRLGRKEMAKQEVDMAQLANETAAELASTWEGRKVNLKIGALPLAHGDSAMLRQVWVNLLSNAIKFTRPREVAQIDVSGHAEGNELVYSVRDNGAGFDMQYADKLFGVFSRLHSAEEFEGTGAGLAIVKRIITRHGGRVWGEGKVNEGAAFSFALPANIINEDPVKGE